MLITMQPAMLPTSMPMVRANGFLSMNSMNSYVPVMYEHAAMMTNDKSTNPVSRTLYRRREMSLGAGPSR